MCVTAGELLRQAKKFRRNGNVRRASVGDAFYRKNSKRAIVVRHIVHPALIDVYDYAAEEMDQSVQIKMNFTKMVS